jgi:general secretion pathway protein I
LCRIVLPERRREAGFTLLEVLVALAVVSLTLGTIGSLMAMSARSTRAIEPHLALMETARAIETALPPRAELALGSMSGERSGHSWRVDVLPYSVPPPADSGTKLQWVPARVVIQVHGPTGSKLQVETVRLLRAR